MADGIWSDPLSGLDLLTLGVGGAVGAALALFAAGARLSASWSALDEAYKTYRTDRTNENAAALDEAFATHEASVQAFSGAIAKLKRALRIK